MVAELGGEDMSEQTWASQASINGPAGCRCLHDAVASGTAHPGAYMTNDLEACWKVLEHLGDIFAELLQSAAAVGTGLFTGEMGVDFTRQMVGQRAPLPGSRRTIQHSRLRRQLRGKLGLVGFGLFELEVALFDLPLDLLRA